MKQYTIPYKRVVRCPTILKPGELFGAQITGHMKFGEGVK
jgi:hypothetical protein